MQPIRRIKRSKSTWQEIFARYAGSGLSVLEFCRGEGINPGVFRRWRSVMNGAGKAAKVTTRAVAKPLAPFIDIGGIDAGRSRFEVRLELGSGMTLSIARG